MTYGELPSRELVRKLSSIAFSTPGKNVAVYRYCMAVNLELDAKANAKRKILENLGTQNKNDPNAYTIHPENIEIYKDQIEDLFSIECSSDIPPHGLSASDFEEGQCRYPENPDLWMTAADIEMLLHQNGVS